MYVYTCLCVDKVRFVMMRMMRMMMMMMMIVMSKGIQVGKVSKEGKIVVSWLLYYDSIEFLLLLLLSLLLFFTLLFLSSFQQGREGCPYSI